MNRLVWCGLFVALSAPALAQTRHPSTHGGASSRPVDVAFLPPTDELSPPTTPNPDSDSLIEVIQSAAVSGNADGAHAISILLLRGVPPRAAAAGLDALGVMARPEGAPAVLRFLGHRRAMLRRHAIAAAQAIHTPALVAALVGRLSDTDEDVRIDAAAALGSVGRVNALGALFQAFDRDLDTIAEPNSGRLMHEAAKAIARIGRPEDIAQLLRYIRRAPFQSMSDAMRLAIGRRDLPEPFKVHVVQVVGDLATPEVRNFLNAVVSEAHGIETPVVHAARTAADRIAE